MPFLTLCVTVQYSSKMFRHLPTLFLSFSSTSKCISASSLLILRCPSSFLSCVVLIVVSRFLALILAFDRQNRRLELRQWPTATDRSLDGLGPALSPVGSTSSIMRSGMPSASNSALNLYPWMRFSFVTADSDNSGSSGFSSGGFRI
jgi:hypothetical protein